MGNSLAPVPLIFEELAVQDITPWQHGVDGNWSLNHAFGERVLVKSLYGDERELGTGYMTGYMMGTSIGKDGIRPTTLVCVRMDDGRSLAVHPIQLYYEN